MNDVTLSVRLFGRDLGCPYHLSPLVVQDTWFVEGKHMSHTFHFPFTTRAGFSEWRAKRIANHPVRHPSKTLVRLECIVVESQSP